MGFCYSHTDKVSRPLTHHMKGPLDGALASIVSNYCHNLELVTNDQVLLAWSRQKLGELGGGIVVT